MEKPTVSMKFKGTFHRAVHECGNFVIEKNLKWLRHVHRINKERLPKQLLYPPLCLGMDNQGRPGFMFEHLAKRKTNAVPNT